MVRRRLVLALLCVTVLAPMVLFSGRLVTTSDAILDGGFVDDVSDLSFGNEIEELHILPQASSVSVKEPIQTIHSDSSSNSDQISAYSRDGLLALTTEELPSRISEEHKSRVLVLSATNEGKESGREGAIKQVTNQESRSDGLRKSKPVARNKGRGFRKTGEATPSRKQENSRDKQSRQRSAKGCSQKCQMENNSGSTAMLDASVQQLKDQLIRAKVYLDLESTRRSPPFIRELRMRIRDVQRALGDAPKDSELPKNAYAILKAMEQTLAKGKQISECFAVVKKLNATLRSTKDQLRVYNRQIMFITQLAAKTIPKGLHCLPLRLTTEYYSLNASELWFPCREKLEDPTLYHYALFSDNVLAAAVVVNSTVCNAKNPESHVFHVVTDRLNYAAMRMWFLANPPGKAAIQVQSIEEFTWLNSSYSPVLKQLSSQSTIDYYFRTHHAKPDGNLKYRNPKYLSMLNHLRFYLPEILPKLNKVVFLDDDVVVQKDLTALWMIDLKGKVNGAVETCGESFHRFDKYLNFSNPTISKNFDPNACGWAFGMNIFDLAEWRKQNITEIYHFWQELNHDRLLWSLGSLPPGLITFYNRTFALDRSWHVLGLGYDPDLNQSSVERAAVIHYNGNMKPWLEIGMPRYRDYWSKYVDYDQLYLRDCNVTP